MAHTAHEMLEGRFRVLQGRSECDTKKTEQVKICALLFSLSMIWLGRVIISNQSIEDAT